MSLLKTLLSEDWGSSDWYPIIKGIDQAVKEHGLKPKVIKDAAWDEANRYYQDMGYDDPEDAQARIIDMWKRRSKTGQEIAKLIGEDAAAGSIGAHAVAAVADRVGSSENKKVTTKRKKKKKKMRKQETEVSLLRRMMGEADESKFDASAVISTLKSAEKSATADEDTTAFGLEDEHGNIVKVYVKADQAEDFEQALETALARNDEDDNEENTDKEIAEVLFELKDKFDIIDVEWGAIPEDEEENQEVDAAGEEGTEGDDLGLDAEGGEEGAEGEGEDDMVADTDTASEEDVKSTLQQVIDMMKADAEAKTAQANAEKAEAEAEAAKYAAQAAAAKVKAEEEILDMESHNKKKAEEEKEAKRLAKLAKYKHEVSQEEPSADFSAENEEQTVDVDDLLNLLRKRVAQNS